MLIKISKLTSLSLVAVYTVILVNQSGCSKKKEEDSESVASYKILNVTGAVGSANSSSYKPLATGVNFGTGSVSGGSGSYYAFQDGKQFINQGKMGDIMSCLVQKLAQRGIIPTDGTSAYFTMPDSSMKMNATLDAATNTITSFNMYNCSSGTQDQFVGSSITGSNATMYFKMNNTSANVSMSISGTVSDGNWATKTITQNLNITNMFIAKSTITQKASTMESQSAFYISSSSTSVQQNSIFSLYGNSEDTYAMGEGSAKTQFINGSNPASENTYSWDDLGATASTSAHLANISTATYLTVPTTNSITAETAFTTDQTWDCQVVGSPVEMQNISSAAQADVNTCFAGMTDGGSGGSQ